MSWHPLTLHKEGKMKRAFDLSAITADLPALREEGAPSVGRDEAAFFHGRVTRPILKISGRLLLLEPKFVFELVAVWPRERLSELLANPRTVMDRSPGPCIG